MSKVANMLNMVQILKDGKIHSIQNLSQDLEVSPRMIRQYKLELEQAGIYIASTTGKYGGYSLEKELNEINIGLTENEIGIVEKVTNILKNDEDKKVLLKVKEAFINNKATKNNKKLEIIQENHKEVIEIYKIVRKAIEEKIKMKITFFSVNSGTTTRIIHPAELFEYIDNWYVAAFCELRNEIRLFKLKDIKYYKLLDEKFVPEITIKKKI